MSIWPKSNKGIVMGSQKKKDGLVVTSETATPLHSGMHPYWDAHWKNIVLQFLFSSHPNVEVEYGNDNFTAVFRKDDSHGRELCETSRSLENPKTIIPESEIDRLVDDLDKLHKEAEKETNTDGARQFSREYRVPDPRQMRGAWRISRGPVQKLLLLWGYHPKGAANDVVLPLTPTSKEWDDARNRVDLKEALREAGRVGKSRLDWGWILARIFSGLLLLILLIFMGYILSQFKGCEGNDVKTPPDVTKEGGNGPIASTNSNDEVVGATNKVESTMPPGPPREDGDNGTNASTNSNDEVVGATNKVESAMPPGPPREDGDNDPNAGTNSNGGVTSEGGGSEELAPVVIPDFMIRLESKGKNDDGSYDPEFKLISQKELPPNSNVSWKLDNSEVKDETVQTISYRPHFSDGSRHVISAVITNPNAKDRQRTPDFVWHPNEPDEGVPGKDVRRFIEQIGEREDKVGTYFLFDVGSDPQDGKVSVLRWSVKKVEPKESMRDINPKYENGNTNVLQIHSSDVAGNAQIEITAQVEIEGKGEREIRAKRTFGISSGDTTDQLTSEENRKMIKAGEGVVPSVYLVLTGKGSGTAFAVGKKHLVTNRHVVDGISKLSLYAARSKEEIKGVVDRIDGESDLALIKIKGKMDMTALALAESEPVYSRQIVSCVGFSVPALNAEKLPSGGVEPSIASGILHGNNPWVETAYSDLKAFHGNSGSPVVNELGKVVGVVFAGTWNKTRDGEINEKSHRSCIVTLTMLKRFLKEAGLSK